MSDIVKLVKEAQESGRWVSVDLAIAVGQIERLRAALLPFAQEATYWVNYQDEEPLVEAFPGYEGNLTVGDLRRAYDALEEK